jgi:alpha-mannosidase
VGLDGTEILTHMTPVLNYDSRCGFDDLLKSKTHHLSLDTTSSALLLFGDGDGGGGPKDYMIEQLRRVCAIGQTSGEVPNVIMGKTLGGFFEQVRKETDCGKRLASWFGELYLEFHRGVSSQRTYVGGL